MTINIKAKGGKPSGTSDSPEVKDEEAPSAGSFLKTGKKAKAALDEEKAKAAARGNHKTFRFYMKPDEERTITFLDGNLDEDGMFDTPAASEHKVKINGRWESVVCIAEEEPCPLCETKESNPNAPVNFASMTTFFTVIDHTEQSGKDNKVYKDQIRLFPANRKTLAILVKNAEKHGGTLVGCTFEVGRSSDKASNVGDVFVFDQQNTLEDLRDAFEEKKDGKVIKKIEALDYAKEITVITASQLRSMGFGTQGITTFDDGASGSDTPAASGDNTDYSGQL